MRTTRSAFRLASTRRDLIRSLRHVEPVSSFRTTFAYTNITHMLAGRIVAKAAGAPDWNVVLRVMNCSIRWG